MPSQRPLPWCKGPKLGPLQFRDASQPEITFHECLGDGAHGAVFRVTIDGTVYALKVFYFPDQEELVHRLDLVDGTRITWRDVRNHNDPFNCECRAYGRLKETNNEHLAARCYGYILLTQQQQDEFGETLRYWDWDGGIEHDSLRCLVKEYIEDPEPFSPNMVGRMMRTIDAINKLGIVVSDIRGDNYRSGILIDLSPAATVPHIELDPDNPNIPEEDLLSHCNRDREFMDDVIDRWNSAHPGCRIWTRFQPHWSYGVRLRNGSGGIPYEMEGARYFALDYDWENPAHDTKQSGQQRTRKALAQPNQSRKRRRKSFWYEKRRKK